MNSTSSAETTDSRSEEHTSELQSRGLISYAVFCLKKKKNTTAQDPAHWRIADDEVNIRCSSLSVTEHALCACAVSSCLRWVVRCFFLFFLNDPAPPDIPPFPPPAPLPS